MPVHRIIWALAASSLLGAACARAADSPSENAAPRVGVVLPADGFSLPKVVATDQATRLAWVDRVGWGASASSARKIDQLGLARWLRGQLHPGAEALPPAAQAQIDAMTISQTPFTELARAMEVQRRAADDMPDVEQKLAARKAYQQELNRLGREAQTRFMLRALYSPDQLKEQMTWFWMNHFSVNARKNNIRALVGDYEENAIRPHALGKFRDLLGATMRHPAMLQYLDNAKNAKGRINENYARELMELHTLGVEGGYSQGDVQELARVLTGIGYDLRPDAALRSNRRPGLVRDGLFVFYPGRHDDGPKTLLGLPINSTGLAEADEALDRLARAPATARFVSTKIVRYFVADKPPEELVNRLSGVFQRSDGDMAAVLQALFESPEFATSLGKKFRDPVHYVVAAVRLAWDDRVATNPLPLLGWLNRMGQPLYAHETPDGYSLSPGNWSSGGQMNTRFEVARAIGASSAVLFRAGPDAPVERPAWPPLAESSVVQAWQSRLSEATRQALAGAASPADWNTFLLASPEFMTD